MSEFQWMIAVNEVYCCWCTFSM